MKNFHVCLFFSLLSTCLSTSQSHAQSGGTVEPKAAISPSSPPRLGFKGRPADDGNGVLVISVNSGSPITKMWRVGDSSGKTWTLERGDIITKINKRKIYDMADVSDALESSGTYCLVTAYDPINDTYRTYKAKIR